VTLKRATPREADPWDVAIPSLKNSEQVLTHTLACLRKGGVPDAKIWIFVISKEVNAYKATTGFKVVKSWEEGLKVKKGKLVVGVLGLPQQRVFIAGFFPVFRHVVEIADDVVDVKIVHDADNVRDAKDLPRIFRWTGDFMSEHKAKLWGLSTTRNPYWASPHASLNPGLIEGSFLGMVNRPFLTEQHAYGLRCVTNETEDVELSVRAAARDGQTLRLKKVVANWVPNYMDSAGGQGRFKSFGPYSEGVCHDILCGGGRFYMQPVCDYSCCSRMHRGSGFGARAFRSRRGGVPMTTGASAQADDSWNQ
jgi:hypothetical protein